MKKIPLVSKCFLVILGLLFCSVVGFAEDRAPSAEVLPSDSVPKTVNVQGKLTTDSGGPITGSKSIVLYIFDKRGGSIKSDGWKETVDIDSDGIYSVDFDLSSEINSGRLNFNNEYKFQVVAADVESKKTPFASSPYAFYASSATYSLILSTTGAKLKNENFYPSNSHTYTIKVGTAAYAIAASSISVSTTSTKAVWGKTGSTTQGWVNQDDIDIRKATAEKLGGIKLGDSTALVMDDEILKINYGAGLSIVENELVLDTTITSLENYMLTTEVNAALAGKQDSLGYTAEDTANKVTNMTESSTNDQYPSAKAVYDSLAGKQNTLDFDTETSIYKIKVDTASHADVAEGMLKDSETSVVWGISSTGNEGWQPMAQSGAFDPQEGLDFDSETGVLKISTAVGTGLVFEGNGSNAVLKVSTGTGLAIDSNDNTVKVTSIGVATTTYVNPSVAGSGHSGKYLVWGYDVDTNQQKWIRTQYGTGGTLGSGGNAFRNGWDGADLAEIYQSTEKLVPGDVVSIDPSKDNAIVKTKVAEDTMVAGVISTEPGVLMNQDEKGYKLALVGKVPTKVCNEGGAIKRGDLLVSASIPGYAKKAGDNPKVGTVIGKALENSDSQKGTILVLVNLQ